MRFVSWTIFVVKVPLIIHIYHRNAIVEVIYNQMKGKESIVVTGQILEIANNK